MTPEAAISLQAKFKESSGKLKTIKYPTKNGDMVPMNWKKYGMVERDPRFSAGTLSTIIKLAKFVTIPIPKPEINLPSIINHVLGANVNIIPPKRSKADPIKWEGLLPILSATGPPPKAPIIPPIKVPVTMAAVIHQVNENEYGL